MRPFHPVSPSPRQCILLVGLLICGLAQADPNKQLKENSPFLPEGHGKQANTPPPPPVTNGPVAKQLEFRGLMKLGGQYSFSLFDKRNNKGYWLQKGKAQDGIRIDNFDTNAQTITVNMNGRNERLTLMSASDAPMPVTINRNTPKPKATNTPPGLPPSIQNSQSSNSSSNKRVIPRRRVILPKK